MSNATQDSRNPGQKRRRRSRGGQNRSKNRNQDHRRDQAPKAEEFRPQGNRPPRKYSAPKLTWWQKILKAIGLYKEPVRPPRPERKPDVSKPQQPQEAKVKSNTRNARTGEGQPQERREKGSREGGRNRDREGGREGGRSRGGDAGTVESSRIYVGNLSYDVSESDLIDLFKGIGGVRNVEIVYNRTTHRSKGYGFVEMLHVDEAKRAVEVLHDQHFMGRKMTVSGAKSKGLDEREEKEDRPERPARQPKAEVAAAPVETVTALQEPAPAVVEAAAEPEAKEIVAAAVENTEATGAPEVIVDAVEHQVAAAVEEQPAEEKQA